jgi:hypothetical protein
VLARVRNAVPLFVTPCVRKQHPAVPAGDVNCFAGDGAVGRGLRRTLATRRDEQ